MRTFFGSGPGRRVFRPRRRPSGAVTLAILCSAVFLLQGMLSVSPRLAYLFPRVFGLSRDMLARGYFWQPFTYMFLHGNFLHLMMNMLVVILFGAGFELSVGTRRFWLLFLVSGIIGGLGWLLLTRDPGAVCIGASGGVFGLIGAYAGLFPNRRVTLLLFFVFPITLQSRVLALFLGVSTLADMLFGQGGQVAHAAHLFGGLAGYAYGRILLKTPGPAAPRRGRRLSFTSRPRRSAAENGDGMPALDDLLDKITRRGLGSLTPAERRALQYYARRGLDGRRGPRGDL